MIHLLHVLNVVFDGIVVVLMYPVHRMIYSSVSVGTFSPNIKLTG